MPSLVSTVGGTRFGTPQKLTDTVGRLAGRLARGKATQTKCVDSVAASFALSTKHRLLAVNPEDNDTRSLQALVLAFDCNGERLLIGTAQGAVYKVDLLSFRFHLLAYVPDEITCLTALSGDPESHVVVGQKNGHLFSVNQVTHEKAAERPAHSSPVLGLCAGTSAGIVCSYCRTQAFVWRGGQLQKLYQLRLNSSAHIVKMVFLSEWTLLGAFADDSVYVWCLESLKVTHEVLQLSRHRAGLADVAAAQDSDVFYAAGKSSQVFEFSLAENRVTRIFSLPDGSGAVARLSVFPGPFYGQILQVLLESGLVKFIHTETGHVVQSLNHPRLRIVRTAASRSGLFLACLLASGHICLHHSTGDVFRRIVLPEALYDSRPRVLLVDESASRAKLPTAGKHPGGVVQAATAAATAARKTPKRGKTPLLNTARLGPIVREHGEFPAQYRRLIWRHLLELPGAHALYVTVAERGQHPSWRHATHRYPVRDLAVSKVLASTLSALAWWCPLFAEVEFLPYFVFPFCNVFSADPLTALELVITLLVNWCQRWFEFFPYPPISVLGLVENMLAHHSPALLKHYMQLGVTAHVYGWPLLETAFSEVFTQNDWLVAWDHILSNHPSFMLAVVVAYNIVSQAALLRCKSADDISYYFRNQNVVSVRHVVRRAYSVQDSTPEELHARQYMGAFEPIGADAYPVFNKFPTFIVNHQTEERERIGREHQTFLEERGAAVQLAREMENNRSKQRQWSDKLAYLKDAESAHRRLLLQSEAKLTSQRRRLAALQRTLQQRGRAERDSERSRALLQQTTEKELLIGRLQDEIRKKRQESDSITQELRQEEGEGGGPARDSSSPPPSPTMSAGSLSSAGRHTAPATAGRRSAAAPCWRGRPSQRVSPPRRPLLTARSSSTYGSPSAGSRSVSRPDSARASPTRATIPPVSPPRRRLSRSPPPDQRARAAAARAAARVAAARALRPLAAHAPAPAAAAAAGGVRMKEAEQEAAGAGLRRRSSLQSSVERGAEQRQRTAPAVARRVRMVPGTVDADIGELEREIDEIAADVATMARATAADSEGDRFGSAYSVTTWNSRSAPDVSSLADAPSLLPAHSSAQRVRQQLVDKWRDEAATSSSGRSHSQLRPSRSQLQPGAASRRPADRQRRSRQTLAPRRQMSYRSML